MKRFKEYNPYQNYFVNLVPGETFPPYSYEYFIVNTIDQIVDKEDYYPEEIDKGGPEAHNPKGIPDALGLCLFKKSNLQT